MVVVVVRAVGIRLEVLGMNCVESNLSAATTQTPKRARLGISVIFRRWSAGDVFLRSSRVHVANRFTLTRLLQLTCGPTIQDGARGDALSLA
jgi:hypothetical protein